MAKTKSNRKRGGAKQRGNWSNADHDARTAKRIASLNKKRRRHHQKEEQEAELENTAAADADADAPHHDGSNAQPPKRSKEQQQQQPPQQQPAPHHERPLHQIRLKKKSHRNNHHRLTSQVPQDAYKRSHLAHDNCDQIDSSKLRLATAQVQRKIDTLKERLEHWDPVTEARLATQQEEQYKHSIEYKMQLDAQNRLSDRTARTQAQSEYNLLYAKHGTNSSQHRRRANLKKKARPGPESWKLRGAARPAWEVYDFDTRFVDVHVKRMEEANARARREKNVLKECSGRFALGDGNDEDTIEDVADGTDNAIINGSSREKKSFSPPQPFCRQYLSLLTQLGSLHLHRNNYSSARTAFLQAIDLEGPKWSTSITNARYQLMNMYLSTNRPSAARKLWNLLENDGSAWIGYAAALIEYVSWNILHEEGSTASSAEKMLTRAIKGNVYVAYLLGWPEMFERAMEYTEEVCERGLGGGKSASILEAIEYACCCYGSNDGEEEEERGMGMWLGTEGSLDWVRSVVLRVLNENNDNNCDDNGENRLTKKDLLSWEMKLGKEEEEFERERSERENASKEARDGQSDNKDDDSGSNEEEDEELDVVMYAGMFRTAMDWLQDAGEFLATPSYEYVNDKEEEEVEGNDVVKKNENDNDDVAEKDNRDGGDENEDSLEVNSGKEESEDDTDSEEE